MNPAIMRLLNRPVTQPDFESTSPAIARDYLKGDNDMPASE